MIDELLNEKKTSFEKSLSHESKRIRSNYHYQSVINLAEAVHFYKTEEAFKLKENLMIFFLEIEELEYSMIGNLESSRLYNEYLLPIGLFLVKRRGFITKVNSKASLVIGLVIDLVLIYFINGYYYPVFTIILGGWGFWNLKKAIKERRVFSMHY